MEESVYVYFSFVWFVYVAMFPLGPTQYVFHTPMARYSLYVLKLPLNTKQTDKQYQRRLYSPFLMSLCLRVVPRFRLLMNIRQER